MPADNKPAPAPPADETKQAPAPRHYKVLSAGLTGAGGVAHYAGAVLTAEQIGDDARIEKLLARGAIEVTTDAA